MSVVSMRYALGCARRSVLASAAPLAYQYVSRRTYVLLGFLAVAEAKVYLDGYGWRCLVWFAIEAVDQLVAALCATVATFKHGNDQFGRNHLGIVQRAGLHKGSESVGL